jgi:hypothetical protein
MRIIEAGHYYSAKGPTLWSLVGWRIMSSICSDRDKSMLFIDDIHSLEDVSPEEAVLLQVEFNPKPDFTVLESAVTAKAWEALDILKVLPSRRRARINAGRWYCSGFPLTTSSGTPNCVLLDAGLTIFKRELGFQEGVNILPKFYEEQQGKLLRLVAKTLPDFHLQVVLFDLGGKFWEIGDGA